eukprot:11165453-Lingulodinium_polyedra.AAC.1
MGLGADGHFFGSANMHGLMRRRAWNSSQTGHGLRRKRSLWNVPGLQTDARAPPKWRFCEGHMYGYS